MGASVIHTLLDKDILHDVTELPFPPHCLAATLLYMTQTPNKEIERKLLLVHDQRFSARVRSNTHLLAYAQFHLRGHKILLVFRHRPINGIT